MIKMSQLGLQELIKEEKLLNEIEESAEVNLSRHTVAGINLTQ